MIVIVVNESLDSKEQVRAVFLWPDVNVRVFYRFPKSFYPDVVLGATVLADLNFWRDQSSAGIAIPYCQDIRLASNRASEYRNRTCADSVERRQLKTRTNPAASSIFGVSNAAEEFSRRSFFQDPTWQIALHASDRWL